MIKKRCLNPTHSKQCLGEFYVYPQTQKKQKLCPYCQRSKNSAYVNTFIRTQKIDRDIFIKTLYNDYKSYKQISGFFGLRVNTIKKIVNN